MQIDFNQPQVAALRAKFQSIDTKSTGFITRQKFNQFVNGEEKIQYYKANYMFDRLPDPKQISEQNFIIFILGHRLGLEEFANLKFSLQQKISKHQTASPSVQSETLKRSYANVKIYNGKQVQQVQNAQNISIKVGLSQQLQKEKDQIISQILGRKVSEIYVLIKFKVNDKGQQIAEKLNETLEMVLQMAKQLSEQPKLTPLLQGIKPVCKYHQGYVYVIVQIKNTFLSILCQYLNQAAYTVSSSPHIMFKGKASSNFKQLLNSNFDVLGQSAQIDASFQIDSNTLSKIKQIMVQQAPSDLKQLQQSNKVFLFLLEQVKLSTSFSNIQECLESIGLDKQMIPKPYHYANQVKENSIKQLISQFIPQTDVLIDMIRDNGQGNSEISLNMGYLMAKLQLNVFIEGFFDML